MCLSKSLLTWCLARISTRSHMIGEAAKTRFLLVLLERREKNNWKFRLKILLNNNLTEIFIMVESLFLRSMPMSGWKNYKNDDVWAMKAEMISIIYNFLINQKLW